MCCEVFVSGEWKLFCFVHVFCLGFVLKASLCVVFFCFVFYFPFLSRLLATSISHFCIVYFVVLLKRGLVVLFKCENINRYSPRRATPLHIPLHDTPAPVSKTLLPCRFLTDSCSMAGDTVVWRSLKWVKQAAHRAPPGGLTVTGNQRLVNFHHTTGTARVSSQL